MDSTITNGVEAARRRLDEAWRTGQPCAPVRDLLPEGDLDAAYAVQELGTEAAFRAGRRLVGRKIGLTSPAVQKQLGVDQPDFGMLFDDMRASPGEPIAWARVQQPKIEAEVAFVLGRDLVGEGLTSADVERSVDHAVAAFEIVGSRIANWDIRIVDTIADNASSGAFVLGGERRRLSDVDLVAARMTLNRGDEAVSQGLGAACLGSPLIALAWLAREMVARGRPLMAGDIVLSGALGPMVAVGPGESFRAEIEGLGVVTATFGS